jgi:integrase
MKSYPFRFRIGLSLRKRIDVVARDEDDAEARAERLRRMVAALVNAGRGAQAAVLLDEAAGHASLRDFSDVERAGLHLASTPLEDESLGKAVPKATYRQIVTEWLAGEYAAKYRGDVDPKTKRVADQDWSVYTNHILPHLGDKPIAALTLADAKLVKEELARKGHRDNTFSRYCRLIVMPFKLAEYPLELIERNPIPQGFVPPAGKARERTYLYPEESRTFLAATDRDLTDRIVWGYLERNGGRPSEAALLQVGDVDFTNGTVTLDHNKTRSPRQWKAERDVLETLWLIMLTDAIPETYFFPTFLASAGKAARTFQMHFQKIGLDRRELLDPKDKNVRKKICAHDARATFVTRAKADRDGEGRPTHRADEHWIRDRTGHTTTKEMDRYRRMARFAAEHHHTEWFDPLTEAIPEIARLKELFLERRGKWPWEGASSVIHVTPALRNNHQLTRTSHEATGYQVGHGVGQSAENLLKMPSRLFPSSKSTGDLKKPSTPDSEGLATWGIPGSPGGPPQPGWVGQSVGPQDQATPPISPLVDPDGVLLRALDRATAAGNLDLASDLLTELRERRRSREALPTVTPSEPDTGIVDVATFRKRRDEGSTK